MPPALKAKPATAKDSSTANIGTRQRLFRDPIVFSLPQGPISSSAVEAKENNEDLALLRLK